MVKSEPQIPSERAHPIALSIAGFDPSSGAGITADLKVFAAHGLYGLAAITALTVQSTQGVRSITPIAAGVLRETLDCLADDSHLDGIKIGMLATPEAVEVVAEFVAGAGVAPERIVLDPVVRSSSGRELLSDDGVKALSKKLLPRIGWVTPNLAELGVLTGMAVEDRKAVERAAARLLADYPKLNVVVTGGHLDSPDDFLLSADGERQWLAGQRVETRATHGTGCAFSSALLANLIKGRPGGQAVAAAKEYVREAMLAAWPVGKGKGPMHHLYKVESSG